MDERDEDEAADGEYGTLMILWLSINSLTGADFPYVGHLQRNDDSAAFNKFSSFRHQF